jgi:hypothetical protein
MSEQKTKLMEMLSGAKQVMDKVNDSNFKVDPEKVNRSMAQSGELLESLPEGATPQPTPQYTNNASQSSGQYKNLGTSKMPDNIKEAMINNPIPKMDMNPDGNPSFSLEDVQELLNKNQQPTAQPQQSQPQTQTQTNQVNESYITNSSGQRLITMTEAELDKKIDDALMNFMSKTFTKNLTENTIKKTINTLIKEGKLKVKSKTK